MENSDVKIKDSPLVFYKTKYKMALFYHFTSTANRIRKNIDVFSKQGRIILLSATSHVHRIKTSPVYSSFELFFRIKHKQRKSSFLVLRKYAVI